MTLNVAGLLGEAERHYLDEREEIEHIVVMLKAQAVQHLKQTA